MGNEHTTTVSELPVSAPPVEPVTTIRSSALNRVGLLTEEELRVALGLTNIWAVRDLKKKRKIPFIQLGHRTVRYDLVKVLRALEKREVKEAGATR